MSASVIDPSTFDDEWFGLLSDREMLIWIGVFSRLRDDQGRFIENAALARARLFPYRDVPVKDVQDAFDRFVLEGRLHRYTAGKHRILQISTWWEHQKPHWAAESKLPSPEGWTDRIKTRQSGSYVSTNWESRGGFARDLRANTSCEPFALAREPEPEPEPIDQTLCRAESAPDDADFEEWWSEYGRVGDKARARDLYRWWRTQKHSTHAELVAAAVSYRTHCAATDCKMKHAATFLAKPTKTKSAVWPEWASGEDHGSMDAGAATHLSDVLAAGARAFGLTGDEHGNGDRRHELGAGAAAGGKASSGSIPALELAD